MPSKQLKGEVLSGLLDASWLDYLVWGALPSNDLPFVQADKASASLASVYTARLKAWALSLLKELFPYRATIEKDGGEGEQDESDEDEYDEDEYDEDEYDEDEYEGYGFNYLYKTDDDRKDKPKCFPKSFMAVLRFFKHLAFLLRKNLQYLLLCCGFAEFPSRRRPKCTTMPWTIWPSLVVLWGVCWMFYPHSSHPNNTRNQFLLNNNLPLFDPNTSLDLIQDSFDWLNDMNIGATLRHEAFEDSNSDPPGQLNLLHQGFREAVTSLPDPNTLVEAASQVTAYQLDGLVDLMPRPPNALEELVKEIEMLKNQSERLDAAVEKLQRQLERSDKEVERRHEMNQKLLEVIDRLTQQGT